ncbi:plastocyanin/azurin family copper-binding protein [Okeania sp. SIO2C9]|uniref:plastocyanin/azurin family copper-binding protein n=1 Tax=Okeania sp. SIO2C9 TaxID=2607791 RepID=UPI0025EDB8A0|nr:plastocyanin/azurin family copper-binding protein [Okeania sp. SIO2C9]
MSKKWQGRWLNQWLGLILGLIIAAVFFLPASAIAAPSPSSNQNLLRQPPTEVKVSLGNSANELKFVPRELKFISGVRYKLLLDNPSAQKHYFTAKDFADASWSQKVEAGKVEVKGAIHELELKPGGEAEWVLVPMKPGTYQLHCSIPGHTEAGMTGEIVIEAK